MDKNGNKTKKQSENEKVGQKEIKKDPSASSGQDETVLLKEKVEELEYQVKRTLADYRNLENRAQNERGEWILKANKQLLLNILPVLDTLMLANRHSQGKDQNLNLSVRQFLDILKKEGVVKIETLEKSFDPNLMEGIQTVEGAEGKVVEEMRAGYMLYDKVLRPAQVIVGKGK